MRTTKSKVKRICSNKSKRASKRKPSKSNVNTQLSSSKKMRRARNQPYWNSTLHKPPPAKKKTV